MQGNEETNSARSVARGSLAPVPLLWWPDGDLFTAATRRHEVGSPQAGATLNSVFPKGTGDFKLTFTQEKEGFAQAEWSKGSAKLATIAITDTNTNPSARDKFREASKKLAGYPAAAVGSQGTAVLVADRFQVQVRSTSPAFSAADRDALVAKCNLQALAGK